MYIALLYTKIYLKKSGLYMDSHAHCPIYICSAQPASYNTPNIFSSLICLSFELSLGDFFLRVRDLANISLKIWQGFAVAVKVIVIHSLLI
jgi:hypothetical protein